MRRILTTFILSTLTLAGCAVGDNSPYEGYEPSPSASPYDGSLATPELDDHGISIPLPPPSLTDEPEQDVYVKGEVTGATEQLDGAVVRAVDLVGGYEAHYPVDQETAEFGGRGLKINLTDNCIELWVVDERGVEGPHREYQATIDATGQGVETIEGCE